VESSPKWEIFQVYSDMMVSPLIFKQFD
jgi:hypothetical protein